MLKADLIKSLVLKPLEDLNVDEAMRILAIRNEPDVRRNMYTSHLIETGEHLEWLHRMRHQSDYAFFAVLLNGEIIGGISLDRFDRDNRRSDWAFYLSASTQGRGIGSALEFKFLDYAFEEQKLAKLNCEVLAFNTPVIGLHKKFGFQDEGLRRRHIIRGGAFVDTVLLGITNDEWRARRPELAKKFGLCV